MTFTSASVLRAICPIRVDLPTPEPANTPTLCPSPTVNSASMARTPSGQRALDPAAAQRIGGGAIHRPVHQRALASGPRPSMGSPSPSSTRPSTPSPIWIDSGPAHGADDRVGADAAAGHPGASAPPRRRGSRPPRRRRRGVDSMITISPILMPGTRARTTRPVTSVTRPEMRSGLISSSAASASPSSMRGACSRCHGVPILSRTRPGNPFAERLFEGVELLLEPGVEAAGGGLDHAATLGDRLV